MSCNCIELEVVDNNALDLSFDSSGAIVERDYERLTNLPQINSVEIRGNHNGEHYGIVDVDTRITNSQIEQLFGGNING